MCAGILECYVTSLSVQYWLMLGNKTLNQHSDTQYPVVDHGGALFNFRRGAETIERHHSQSATLLGNVVTTSTQLKPQHKPTKFTQVYGYTQKYGGNSHFLFLFFFFGGGRNVLILICEFFKPRGGLDFTKMSEFEMTLRPLQKKKNQNT